MRDDVLEVIDTDTVVNTVQQLDSDDAVFVLEDMDEGERQEVLEQIPQTDRLVLERALDFPEDSAGRLMQSSFISVPPFWSVGRTIDYLRDTKDLPDDFLEIYIIDPTYSPVGVVHLAGASTRARIKKSDKPKTAVAFSSSVVSRHMHIRHTFTRKNLFKQLSNITRGRIE